MIPLQTEKLSQADKSEDSVTEKIDCDKHLENITQADESNKQMCHVTIEFSAKDEKWCIMLHSFLKINKIKKLLHVLIIIL